MKQSHKLRYKSPGGLKWAMKPFLSLLSLVLSLSSPEYLVDCEQREHIKARANKKGITLKDYFCKHHIKCEDEFNNIYTE